MERFRSNRKTYLQKLPCWCCDRRPAAELYAFNLRDTIPPFALPLRSGDQEPTIDLNQALNQVYEEAALELAIDDTQQPVPPVSEDNFAWIQTLNQL